MKRNVLILAIFVICLNVGYSQKSSISIYIDSNRHKISPFIYGINGSIQSDDVKSVRQGGNRWTGYNWENSLSNAGNDYNFISDGNLLMGIPTDSSSEPGAACTYFFEKARDMNQFFLTTVPMAGYVAAIGGTATTAPSSFWNTITIFKNAPFSKTPDLTDKTVYVDEYIYFLKSEYGISSKGGITAYGLDNEPDIWNKTHSRLHPSKTLISELIYKTVQTAKAIKSIDSTALVFGPSLSGWNGFKTFYGNDDKTWNSVCSKETDPYFNDWFLSLYLDSMKYYSSKTGKRLIDVVNVHWYPESADDNGIRIVNVTNGPEYTSQTAIRTRLQAPRSLWDTTYIEPSYITNSIKSPVKLLKRIKASINKFNPETKIGITEYRFGTENHYSGGLALTDALGIFGQEGVYYASKWYATGSTIFLPYSTSAFELYTNYDGKNSMFGDISIPTKNSSNDTLSSFASIDKDNKLHIITINKVSTSTIVSLDLNGGYYLNAAICGFDSTNASITKRDSIKSKIAFNKCSYSLPPYSALHFVFTPVKTAKLVKAETDSIDNTKIKAIFSKYLKTSTLKNTDIEIKGKDGILQIRTLTSQDSSLYITLINGITLTDTSLYISIKNTLFDTNGYSVPFFKNIKVNNILKNATNQVFSNVLLESGNIISMTFSKTITSASVDGFVFVNKGKDTLHIISNKIIGNSLNLTLKERLDNSGLIVGKYIDNKGIIFNDKTSFTKINNFPVSNQVNAISLNVDSISILNAGFILSLQCNKRIDDSSLLKDIKLLINNSPVEYTGVISKTKIYLNVLKKLENTDNIRIEYTDNGLIKSIENGYLHSFSKNVTNTIPQPPASVVIPNVVEAESYYYKIGNVFQTTNSSTGKGNSLKIESGSLAAYRITVPKDGLYSVNITRCNTDNFDFVMELGSYIDTLKLPSTGSFTTFKTYGVIYNLVKGDYVIIFKPIKPLTKSVEIDYITFLEGNHIPKASYLSGQIASTGKSISITLDNYIKTKPSSDAFNLKVDQKVQSISSVTFKDNFITIYPTENIYSKQFVQLSLIDSTIQTLNGSTVELFNRTLLNYSQLTSSTLINDLYLYYSNNAIKHNFQPTASITMYNVLGEMVFTHSAEDQTISIDQIASGCYFVVVSNNGETIYQTKIIITK